MSSWQWLLSHIYIRTTSYQISYSLHTLCKLLPRRRLRARQGQPRCFLLTHSFFSFLYCWYVHIIYRPPPPPQSTAMKTRPVQSARLSLFFIIYKICFALQSIESMFEVQTLNIWWGAVSHHITSRHITSHHVTSRYDEHTEIGIRKLWKIRRWITWCFYHAMCLE